MNTPISIRNRTRHGSIVRVDHGFFGPGDPYGGVWHLLPATARGAEG